MKMAFCLRAIKTLGDQDLSSLTDKVEAYTQAGMGTKAAEMAAVNDMLAEVQQDRDELHSAIREQHPELFAQPKKAGKEPAPESATLSAAEKAAPKYPLAPAGSRYEETDKPITMMTPDAFLAAVRPLEIDDSSRDNIDDLKAHILAGKPLDPLHIRADGKEDGRHRAVAAQELGIKQVPVVDERTGKKAAPAEVQTTRTDDAGNVAMFSKSTTEGESNEDGFWSRLGRGDLGTVPQSIAEALLARTGRRDGAPARNWRSGPPTGLEQITFLDDIGGSREFVTFAVEDRVGDNFGIRMFLMATDAVRANGGRRLTRSEMAALSVLDIELFGNRDAGFELSVGTPVPGDPAFDNMPDGIYAPTGRRDSGGVEYFKLNIGNRATNDFMSEAVRRFGLRYGFAPKVTYSRETGASVRPGKREIQPEIVERKYSQAQPPGPAITEPQARAAVAATFGDKAARALLDGGLIEFVTGRDFNGATFSDGRIQINLSSVSQDTIGGVLKHEAFHAAAKDWLGAGPYAALERRFVNLIGAIGGGAVRERMAQSVGANTKLSRNAVDVRAGIYKALDQAEVVFGAGVGNSAQPVPAAESANELRAMAKELSDFNIAQPGRNKTADLAELKRVMPVLRTMRAIAENPQVFNAIVELVPIDVVNMLARQERSSDGIGHDNSVGVVSGVPALGDVIAADTDVPAAVAHAFAFARDAAKVASGVLTRRAHELDSASAARNKPGTPHGASEWVRQAVDSVPKDTNSSHFLQEVMAYAVERHQQAGAKQPGMIAKWVQDFLSALRTAIIRLMPNGKIKTWALQNIQPQDLARMAVSAMQARGSALRSEGALAFSGKTEGQAWYSALADQISKASMNAGPASAWQAILKNLTTTGKVKADEIEWSGLGEWLAMQPGKVSKAQVGEFLAQNGVQVTETALGRSGRSFFWSSSGQKIEFDSAEEAQAARAEEMVWADSMGVVYEGEWRGARTIAVKNDVSNDPSFSVAEDEGGLWSGEDGNGRPLEFDSYDDAMSAAEEAAETARNAWKDKIGEVESAGDTDTKYGQYQLPGGTNYREVLLTLPVKQRGEIPPGYRLIDEAEEARADGLNVPAGETGPWRFRGPSLSSRSYKTREEAVAAMMRDAQSEVENGIGIGDYRSSHWDQPNVLAHIRLNDRVDADGNRVLFVEEVQSDYGQEGKKKGFTRPTMTPEQRAAKLAEAKGLVATIRKRADADRAKGFDQISDETMALNKADSTQAGEIMAALEIDKGIALDNTGRIPGAPFVTATDKWVALAMKRVVKLAVDGGYDKVAFVTGEQSAARYDLSKQVDAIKWQRSPNGVKGYVAIEFKSNDGRARGIFEAGGIHKDEDLQDVVGKEVAKRILEDGGKKGELSGVDLKVGGEGMKKFYDAIVLSVAKDVLRKLGGGALGETNIANDSEGWRITPPEQTASGRWMLKSSDYNSNGLQFDTEAEAKAALVEKQATSTQPSFDITDALREKALGGMPMFSRTTSASAAGQSIADRLRNAGGGPRIVGDTGRYTPEQLAAMSNVGFQVEAPTLEDRAKALWKNVGQKLAQGMVDQFAPVKSLDSEAYSLLRLAKGASGAFETLLQGGKLKLNGGVYDFDDQAKGGVIETLLKPLGGEHHDFFRWIAANRAERLKADGKENLFSEADIAALKTLADGQTEFDYTIQNGAQAGQTTRDRSLIYADALKTFNGFNKNVLDMAEQSGLIDGESRAIWEHDFYVPFYRVADEKEGGVRGINIKGGAVRQQAFKTLKGGAQALNADLLDNTLMNWAHLIDASAKNRAAKATLEAAARMGVAVESTEEAARQMAKSAGKPDAVVWFMDDGVKRFYAAEDPMLLTAISSLEYAGMRSPIMTALGSFKHALTVGVTASPFFKVRNLIRDSVQAIGTAPIGYNPASNIAQGWALTDPKSDAYFRLLAGGGTIHFGTMMEGNEAKRVQALVESGVDTATILNSDQKMKAFYRKFIEPSITAYNELGNRGEAITRAALYAQLTAQGMSHAQASLQARDLMDFSMQGSFTSVRFLAQVVPFFNARLQGLYKLGRAAKEDPARFSAVIGAATLAGLSLMLAYSDDDDWKKREDWDRNGYWWFKFGGTAFRIPKPFEIGAIATLAERGFEYAFDNEMTGKRFRSNVLSLLGDNLSMNPIPQMVKPLLDVYANKDSFTGRPIENMGMERLKSEYRFTSNTSMLARGASTVMNAATGLVGAEALSPVQVDHMLRGYFGWLGTFVVGAGDILARPLTGQPDKPDSDILKAATGGMLSDLRDAPSRYVSQMYEQAKSIEKDYATWRELLKEGKVGEAQEFYADHREDINRHKVLEHTKKAEAKVSQEIKRVELSSMSGEMKRARIRELLARKDRIARPVMAVN